MSATAHTEPVCTGVAQDTVELCIKGRAKDLGDGFTVRRLLPASERQMVGPFVFFDHMGPVTLPAGRGLDVRPHPHIGLATVTYLFEGEIMHRDSLGTELAIRPGELNWMTAGRGIVHSERSPESARRTGASVHGLQLWVALPHDREEMDPSFQHYGKAELPELELHGARACLVAGSAFGREAPVQVASPLFYVDVDLQAGANLGMPEEYAERGLYVVDGAVNCENVKYSAGDMLIFRSGASARIGTDHGARVMLFGGDPMDGPRFVWWNFVSSSRARIEQAKRDWTDRRFPEVPGDTQEFIPLPDK